VEERLIPDRTPGIGRENPNKALNIRGFKLTKSEKSDLIAFPIV